jgi:hypothetical protein
MSALVSRSWRVSLVGAVTCVLIGTALVAQEEPFRRGLEAREDRQWPVAAARMRDAIAARSQESPNKIGARLGFGGTEYLPYYFLGEALLNTGDCAGAVNAWAISEQQGIVQKVRPEFAKIIRSGYLECEKKGVLPPGKLDPALARVAQLITEANRLAGNVTTLAEANLDVWRAEGGLREQFDRGRAEIESARGRYEAARTSRAQRDLDAAAAAVERSRPILVAVEANFRTTLDSRQSAQGLIREVNEAIGAADALNNQIEGKRVPFTPSMTTSYQEGREALGRARDRLNEGQKSLNPQTLVVARTSATDAQNRFRQVLDDLGRIEKESGQRVVSEALTRALEAYSLMDSAAATLERFTNDRPGVLPADKEAERKAVQEQVSRARRRLDQARRSDNPAVIAEAAKLAIEVRDRLTLLIGAFGPLTLRDRGVHEALEQGARQYLGGEYQQAVSSLAAAESLQPDVALQIHFHLFRAAALYELFLRSQGKDQALEAQALAEVQHCKSIDSAFQPDARAFSPRFVAYYQSVTALPVPAAPPAAVPAAPVPQP